MKSSSETSYNGYSEIILENLPYAVIQLTSEGKIIGWNRSAELLYGYSRQEVLGVSVEKLKAPDDMLNGNSPPVVQFRNNHHHKGTKQTYATDRNTAPAMAGRTVGSTASADSLLTRITKTKKRIKVRCRSMVISDNSSAVGSDPAEKPFLIEISQLDPFTDTTEQMYLEIANGRLMIDNLLIAIGIVDIEGNFLRANQPFHKMLGYSKHKLQGLTLYQITHPEDVSTTRTACANLQSGHAKYYQMEKRYLTSNGKVIWTVDMISLARDPANSIPYFVVQMDNITAHKKEHDELARLAFHDPLTDLANASGFTRNVELTVLSSQPDTFLSVLMVNLDDFKKISHGLGQTMGDNILKETASRIKLALRAGDMPARMGGDEFAILLKNANEKDGLAVANRTMQYITKPFLLEKGIEIFLTASVGIASQDVKNIASPEQLIRNAGIALNTAKSTGKGNCIIFDPPMHEKALERISLETDLRKAIEANELRLEYQPIVSLVTGKMVAVEALARWPHAKRGMIPPLEFIPIAEDNGLIIPLGLWVLNEAVSQLKKWDITIAKNGLKDRKALNIAVNVSIIQLLKLSFIDELKECIATNDLDPNRLIIEITESTLLDSSEVILNALKQIYEMGIQLAIDDFGTGYSSLSRIHSLPIDSLKIDREFIKEIVDPKEKAPLVTATIAMATGLNLEV
ncbi:MAG: EAL domain-containing protein, partial [Actinobacteria bacterium]|nr:EAL domain-containing protein [Actinomycetota bacterium]